MNKAYTLPVSVIYIALANNWLYRWSEKQRRFSYLPSAEQAIAELRDLSRRGTGIPTTVIKNANGKQELRLYGSECYLGLYPTQYGDGYLLSYIEPLHLKAHETLANGVLLLNGPNYMLYSQLSQIPRGHSNCWVQICREWDLLEYHKRQARESGTPDQEAVTPLHKNYLTTIESMIDTTYQLEQEKYKLTGTIPYIEFFSAGERRNALNDIYEFRLAKPMQALQERYLLRIKEVPDMRGSISSYSGTRLTVRFENLIDRKRIPPQGNFEITPNSVIFKVQRRAVRMLSEGEAKNPYLLRVLVDRHYQPYQPAKHSHPSLNAEQLVAFQGALTVPDLMLVLGPPGTGKTHTITEILLHHCILNKKRVLVTASTHKAVDNVLSRLPRSLEVVRWGNEGRVAEDTRHLLIDAKSKEMQTSILQQTGMNARRLSCFIDNAHQIKDWLNQLSSLIEQIQHDEQQQARIHQRKQWATQRVTSNYQEEGINLEAQLRSHAHRLSTLQKQLDKHNDALKRATAKVDLPLIGWFFGRRAHYHEQRLLQTQESFQEIQRAYDSTKQEYASLQTIIQSALWADAEYRMVEDMRQQVEQVLSGKHRDASKTVGLLAGTIEHLISIVPPPASFTGVMLQNFLSWYSQQLPLLERRASLIRDWRKELEERTAQLRPELMRYADVIGATCIGIATVEGLEDIEFDLAIVDEAGQICLSDLLVPLVRARRAVLVGDHQQLPPFVDNDVRDWLDGLSYQEGEMSELMDNDTIAGLLTRSTFELLFQDAARNRRLVRLIRQFRMPQVIADFASQHFYEKQLLTESAEKLLSAKHDDPLFRCPLAVIDTTSIAAKGNREQRQLSTESWAAVGYVNKVEAQLIASLAVFYEQINVDWVIIVPYRAQARYIIDMLQSSMSLPAISFGDRVSTVDSFQGSECSKVIYGFTRSNNRGDIGFLSELRRLNVAMTRAKEQLVIVGDFSLLAHSKDTAFRSLMQSLYQHALKYGEILSYEQCQDRLSILNGKK